MADVEAQAEPRWIGRLCQALELGRRLDKRPGVLVERGSVTELGSLAGERVEDRRQKRPAGVGQARHVASLGAAGALDAARAVIESDDEDLAATGVKHP